MSVPVLPVPVREGTAESEFAERLDLNYIALAGHAAAAELTAGRPVEIAYTPGDGTQYGLVLVRLDTVSTVAPRKPGWPCRAATGMTEADPDGGPHRYKPNGYLLSWINHGSYPVWLGPAGDSPAYTVILEKYAGQSIASAVALALLLRAIATNLPPDDDDQR